jgi:hypothetical protein
MVAIAAGDETRVREALHDAPGLATVAIDKDPGGDPTPPVLQRIGCYCYRGDTALHVAASAHRPRIATLLLDLGADVSAHNRRGTTPLHCAAVGNPNNPRYDAGAQVETIRVLIAAGADPEVVTVDGVTPLHRAVRCRCSAAVATLLESGASPVRPNGHGSSPLGLAHHTTGRGGSGTAVAKGEQAEIVRLLNAAISAAPM